MDDASEWEGVDGFLDSLGQEPITLEALVEYIEANDSIIDGEVPVEELLRQMRAARS